MPEFERDGVALYYQEWGDPDAPAVLLLHGFTFDQRMWMPHVEAFARDYRVVAPDLRAHGRSAAPEDLDEYSMDIYAADVNALLGHLAITACALVGSSFGGMIALHFAVTWPALVAGLVVSDASPAADHPAYTEAFREREAVIAQMAQLIAEKGTDYAGKQAAARVNDPFLADAMRKRYAAMSREGFLGAQKARTTRPDLVPRLREALTMPVLLCWGEDDPVSSARDVMAAELPGARIVTFAETGHAVPMLRPDAFIRTVLAFFADIEDAQPIAGRRRL
ncbi:MAG: alpha/beta fold hydrolase [Tepidiformaceae bacterium]